MFLSRAALVDRARCLASTLNTSRGALPRKSFFKLESTHCWASQVDHCCRSTTDMLANCAAFGHASPAGLRNTPESFRYASMRSRTEPASLSRSALRCSSRSPPVSIGSLGMSSGTTKTLGACALALGMFHSHHERQESRAPFYRTALPRGDSASTLPPE